MKNHVKTGVISDKKNDKKQVGNAGEFSKFEFSPLLLPISRKTCAGDYTYLVYFSEGI